MASHRTLKPRTAVAISLSLILVMVPLGMAQAASIWISDNSGDTASRSDIKKVVAELAKKRVRIQTRLNEVVSGVEHAVYIDTRSKNAGPEWLIRAYPDSEWAILRVAGWKDRGKSGPSCGRVRYSGDSDASVVIVRVPWRCLNVGKRVRVSVRVHDAGHGVDWAPARKDFSGWVTRGPDASPAKLQG